LDFIDKDNVLTLLGERVLPGTGTTINFNLAKLYTTAMVEVPIIVERAIEPGPVVLITSGIHGDEINGVEIVRQLIAKKINKPIIGTIICIPVLNIFGFLDMKRAFPVCMDFHTGGAYRFNAAQVRIDPIDIVSAEYATVFNAPFTLHSKTISKSYRATCSRLGIPVLLFEGGKSKVSDKSIARYGVSGAMRVLEHLEMLNENFEVPKAAEASVLIEKTRWYRSKYSGLLHTKVSCGALLEEGQHIATITDPYGKFRHVVRAKARGYVINVNEASLVYQGDAIFNISVDIAND